MTLERLINSCANPPEPQNLYLDLQFPEAPEERPYVYLNMVSTADGKILIGDIGGTAAGVGGPTDQLLFRRLQKCCDAAMIGGSTLRAGTVIYPLELPRFVVTGSGDLPLKNRFFTDAPGRAYILAPKSLPDERLTKLSNVANVIKTGDTEVDLAEALRIMRTEMGINVLLCEGGPTLNDHLLQSSLADELFLTIAPKLKGGAYLPNAVDGAGFPSGFALPLNLISLYRDEDELYLRYSINKEPRRYGKEVK